MNNQPNIPIKDNQLPVQQSEPVSNHSALLLRIADLKEVKIRQEKELKISLSGLASTLNLVSLFSGKGPKENQLHSPVQSGVNKAIGLVLDIAFSRNRSIPGILSSVLLSKAANTLISKNLPSLILGIGSLFRRRRKA